jgi:predicted acetyltransferase
MGHEEVTLVAPQEKFQWQFLAMVEEFRTAGENRHESLPELVTRGFGSYIRHLHDMAEGKRFLPGFVPSTTFWLVVNGTKVVGESHLRHYLTWALKNEGGHIGYAIRPSERRKGYGTRILALTLEKAMGLGLERVLVTCDTDNVASARIIEKNGGIFQDQSISKRSGKPVSRYWIEIGGKPL